jgi:hypothetical protein
MMTLGQNVQGEEVLREIEGARLTSVQFILDYVTLGFDEKGSLATFVWPQVIDGQGTIGFGESGYRDRLCSLIAKVVTVVQIDPDETMSISLDDAEIRIPLGAHTTGGERAVLSGHNHLLCVW